MGWRREEDPADDDDDEDGEDYEEDVEAEAEMFAPTSLKYLDLNNPLRRHCIRIMLSPWVYLEKVSINLHYSPLRSFVAYLGQKN